ncbi:hypothetical protein CRG98_027298, partial [Punica granatum]
LSWTASLTGWRWGTELGGDLRLKRGKGEEEEQEELGFENEVGFLQGLLEEALCLRGKQGSRAPVGVAENEAVEAIAMGIRQQPSIEERE